MIIRTKLKQLVNLAFSPRYLLITNSTIGLGGLIVADTGQQLANHYLDPSKSVDNCYVHDTRRTASLMTGGLVFGFAGHHWYNLLDKKFPGKSMAIVSKKLLCEAIAGPPIIAVFFYLVARSEGKSTTEWYKSFKEAIPYILASDWLFFIPLQALNFYLLPPKYRLLFVTMIAFVYDNFLIYIFHK